ncbi:MAG: hypothetical protein LBJ08_09255 [Bifidobacteriaceae bacterium]|jgi:hypothetical protein|nr:hypothetical protein [Bifidobacteriaceae bacterium]
MKKIRVGVASGVSVAESDADSNNILANGWGGRVAGLTCVIALGAIVAWAGAGGVAVADEGVFYACTDIGHVQLLPDIGPTEVLLGPAISPGDEVAPGTVVRGVRMGEVWVHELLGTVRSEQVVWLTREVSNTEAGNLVFSRGSSGREFRVPKSALGGSVIQLVVVQQLAPDGTEMCSPELLRSPEVAVKAKGSLTVAGRNLGTKESSVVVKVKARGVAPVVGKVTVWWGSQHRSAVLDASTMGRGKVPTPGLKPGQEVLVRFVDTTGKIGDIAKTRAKVK